MQGKISYDSKEAELTIKCMFLTAIKHWIIHQSPRRILYCYMFENQKTKTKTVLFQKMHTATETWLYNQCYYHEIVTWGGRGMVVTGALLVAKHSKFCYTGKNNYPKRRANPALKARTIYSKCQMHFDHDPKKWNDWESVYSPAWKDTDKFTSLFFLFSPLHLSPSSHWFPEGLQHCKMVILGILYYYMGIQATGRHFNVIFFLIHFLIQFNVLADMKSTFQHEAQCIISTKIIGFCCFLGQANSWYENFKNLRCKF